MGTAGVPGVQGAQQSNPLLFPTAEKLSPFSQPSNTEGFFNFFSFPFLGDSSRRLVKWLISG